MKFRRIKIVIMPETLFFEILKWYIAIFTPGALSERPGRRFPDDVVHVRLRDEKCESVEKMSGKVYVGSL